MRLILFLTGSIAAMVFAAVAVLPALGISPPMSEMGRMALAAGQPKLAAMLLNIGAQTGDAAAMNDLGVLLYRGTGVEADPAEAARLLAGAAETGLPRAKLNLLVANGSGCGGKEDFAQFEDIALTGDIIAASFAADCIGGDRIRGSWMLDFPTWGSRLLKIAEIGGAGDAEEKVKFAWLLLAAQVEPQHGIPGSESAGDAAVRDQMLTLAAKLFLEAREDKPAAFYGLATLRESYPDRLAAGSARDAIMGKSKDEWLMAGAEAKHQVSGCEVAKGMIQRFLDEPTQNNQKAVWDGADIIDHCLFTRTSERDVILIRDGGKSVPQSFGYDFTRDRWMASGPLLMGTPKYKDYDFKQAAHDQVITAFNKMRQFLGT